MAVKRTANGSPWEYMAGGIVAVDTRKYES